MKKLFALLFVLISYEAHGQKKTFLEFQLGAIKTNPISGFIENDKVSITGGSITPSFSALVGRRINPNLYIITGLNANLKNAKIQQKIDTLTYTGVVYTQPQYRTVSIPLLLGFQKAIDIDFNPVTEKKRIIGIAAGFTLDFVKESRIKDGTSVRGRGFNIRTTYKTNYAFLSNTGISFNCLLTLPVIQFKNGNNINLVINYKYPFYTQNTLNVNYKINDDYKSYEVKRLRLQELSIGISTRFYK